MLPPPATRRRASECGPAPHDYSSGSEVVPPWSRLEGVVSDPARIVCRRSRVLRVSLCLGVRLRTVRLFLNLEDGKKKKTTEYRMMH